MEHDVTEDPGSWIWARWRGFGALLVIWSRGRVAVGDHVEVRPRAAGFRLTHIHYNHERRGPHGRLRGESAQETLCPV